MDPNGETFIVKRNELLKSYKEDTLYSLERLAEYLREQKRAIIINIDNTDQFDQNLQDYCFSLASELSEKLHSISIISLLVLRDIWMPMRRMDFILVHPILNRSF